MGIATLLAVMLLPHPLRAEIEDGQPAPTDAEIRQAIDKGLAYLANNQSRDGRWELRWESSGGTYPVAMTALSGMCFLLDGNTTLQGRYAENVQSAVGYILSQSRPNGLIGDARQDQRYLYGHGFSMLFLSQVLGEEEDIGRRRQIVEVLTRAAQFSGAAQTLDGGWGYVSAREGNGFDEGSVTITQMQGLRSCRNAGIPVNREIIEGGIDYIEKCTDAEGGVRYSLKTNGGVRPPITAAAACCLFNAGDYDSDLAKRLIAYSDKTLSPLKGQMQSYGHWHYAHYYYSQVVYRQGDDKWKAYRDKVFRVIIDQQNPDGSWNDSYIGTVYTTALNLTILQIDNNYLPIYQR